MACHVWTRRLSVFGIVIVALLLAAGCAQRTSHGLHQHGKKSGKAATFASQGKLSKEPAQKQSHAEPSGGEGYFTEDAGSFSGLLEEEPMIREGQFGSDVTAPRSLNDYWVNRMLAEQLTAKSGLQDVHFSFDSFELDEQAKATLGANAEWLKAHPHAEITIEGHCDDRGTASYNQVLGEKRAMRTKNYLTRLGVPAERLHIMSFGKDNPACWESTESCYQQNRRAHLVLDISVASTAMRYTDEPFE